MPKRKEAAALAAEAATRLYINRDNRVLGYPAISAAWNTSCVFNFCEGLTQGVADFQFRGGSVAVHRVHGALNLVGSIAAAGNVSSIYRFRTLIYIDRRASYLDEQNPTFLRTNVFKGVSGEPSDFVACCSEYHPHIVPRFEVVDDKYHSMSINGPNSTTCRGSSIVQFDVTLDKPLVLTLAQGETELVGQQGVTNSPVMLSTGAVLCMAVICDMSYNGSHPAGFPTRYWLGNASCYWTTHFS